MSIRRAAAILSIVAIVFAACSGAASNSPSAAASTGAGASVAASVAPSTAAAACKVGVAWSTFQEERYGLRDEPGIKAALAAGGATYIGNDAKNNADTQASNVATLLAAGVNVIVINAYDPAAILPSVKAAVDAGIPVIAYDRELENAKALFLTHDNVLVGHMIADAVTKAQPTGNYAIIKGDKTQTNPIFLRAGMEEVIAPLLASKAITIPAGAEVFTDGWKADLAQTEMEQILTANNNKIDAVLSENDNMATGAVAALKAQGLDKTVKIGAQDGDKFALNRVALGTQVVSVWKDATELGTAAGKAALELCKNPDISKVTGAVAAKTTKGLDTYHEFLKPIPITKDNLQVVLDAKWITKAELCKDVTAGSVTGC
jgi:D-xylose transport system substrate-binding protein